MNTGDPTEYVKNFIMQNLLSLKKLYGSGDYQCINMKPYICQVNFDGFMFSVDSDEGKKMIILSYYFNEEDGAEKGGLGFLLQIKMNSRYLTLMPGYIEEIFSLKPEAGEYPKMQFGWTDGNGRIDPQLGGEKGDLILARYDEDLNSFINYEGADLKKSFVGGDKEIFISSPKKFPKDIKNRKIFCGQKLRRNIDFDKTGRDIIKKAELNDIIMAIRVYNKEFDM